MILSNLPSLPPVAFVILISDGYAPLRGPATYSSRSQELLVPTQDHSVIHIKGQDWNSTAEMHLRELTNIISFLPETIGPSNLNYSALAAGRQLGLQPTHLDLS